MSLTKRCFMALLALMLTACSAPAAAPTATTIPTQVPPTATALPTRVPPTATLVPSPTATLAPTNTPTPVPTNTPIPTPTLTPTPAGYYKHPAGFSLVLPAGWKVAKEYADSVSLSESATGMGMDVFEFNMTHDATLDDFVQFWLGKDLPKAKRGKLGDVALADSIGAPSVDYRYITPNGAALTFRFALIIQHARHYGFALYALEDVFQAREQVFNRILSTVQLHNWVYGLERSQVIVQIGSMPDPEDLDPALTLGGGWYIAMLYAGLVRLDSKLQIEPVLAEKWIVSPDGLTYTFTLRDDLKFQSGEPLTAADVKYSWERAADPKTKSPTAATYLGDIVGVKDKLAGKAKDIAGVKVIDAQTLAVTLDGPKPYFLAKLTYPTSYVVRQANVESSATKWMFKPDASGPYGLRDLRTDEAVILERNPAYFEPATTPYLLFLLNPTGSDLSLYQAGLIDLAYVGGESAVQVRKDSDPLNSELQSATSLCTSMLRLDTAKPPLDDPNFRLALALALDRDKLVEQFSLNLNVRANSVLPPAMPGYSAEQSSPEFDVKAARQALAASKYAGKMPALVINEARQGGKPGDMMNAIVQMWRQNLGLTNIKVVTLDPRGTPKDKRDQHGNIVFDGWCADYPDPQNFLDILFHSESDFNAAAYSSAEVDQLLEKARVEQDPARRLDLYAQAETNLLEEVAVIPVWHGVTNVLVKPYLKGYVEGAMGGTMLHRVSMEGYVEQ